MELGEIVCLDNISDECEIGLCGGQKLGPRSNLKKKKKKKKNLVYALEAPFSVRIFGQNVCLDDI